MDGDVMDGGYVNYLMGMCFGLLIAAITYRVYVYAYGEHLLGKPRFRELEKMRSPMRKRRTALALKGLEKVGMVKAEFHDKRMVYYTDMPFWKVEEIPKE